MTTTLTFSITLNSDYHISAGHGHGATIDSALLRDADGVPVIRGTTLAGLLRDGLWRLLQLEPLRANYPPACQASGAEVPGYCSRDNLCPVCRLLGTPAQPRHWQISSARPAEMPHHTTQAWQRGRMAAQVAQRARISPRTRRAETRKLFSQEEGVADLKFTFTITSPYNGDGALDEAALWGAAARMVRQLGRSRRRGQGECLFTLDNLTSDTFPADVENHQDWLLERFAQNWLTGAPAKAPQPTAATIAAAPTVSPDARPRRFRLLVRADEPLIIARRSEAGNQFETLKAISGSVVRGALAWQAAHRFDLSDRDSTTYAAFAKLFLRDGVTFPALYPVRLNSKGTEYYPAVPAPLNWLTCKTVGGLPDEGHGMQLLGDGQPTQCLIDECGDPLKNYSGEFVVLSSETGNWEDENFLFSPDQRSELHVELDPRTGRSVEERLYTYTALEASQYFVGDLVCRIAADWELLRQLTGLAENEPISLRLGKAIRRGYGQVTLWLEPLDDKPATWLTRPVAERLVNPNDIILTLLTDTIITDPWGRFMDGFDDKWLAQELGLQVEFWKNSAAARVRAVDGFNGQHGLPRWRDLALQAGSAVRLKLVNPPADWRDKLAQVEQTGIGLRCNEGFGQIAFNHPLYQAQSIEDADIYLEPEMRLDADNDPDHSVLAKARSEKIWQETLDNSSNNWTKCKDSRFMAVARWLHHHIDTPPAELAQRIRSPQDAPHTWRPGEPDQQLIEVITQDEYGDRTKENKLTADHNTGLQLIADILGKLAENRNYEPYWPLGVQMLAERVAASVEKKGDDQ